MTRTCTVSVNGRSFPARVGDRLLDAALLQGIAMPHDCRAGQCGSCIVALRSGHVLGGRTDQPGAVRACQAHIVSDLDVTVDDTPAIDTLTGVVVGMAALAHDVIEITLATERPYIQRPGQYARITFAGFPVRTYSPTIALDGGDQPGTFRLQVRRYATGRVSAAFGRDIQVGHPVEVEGPFGSAYFRHGSAGRLVIVSSGTGFAPVWSIADAALRENANRAILVLAGARTLDTLYMAPALQRMSTCPNVMIVPLVAELQQAISVVRRGRPEDYASCIVESDVVHAAGTPDMVSAVAAYAVAAGATFHADPFVVGPQEAEISLTEKARRWLGARREPWQRNYASSHQQELSSGPRI